MATHAKMVYKNQERGKREDSSPETRSWSADLPHTLCTVIVVPLYISSGEMFHFLVPLVSLRKAPLWPPARLCSESPRKVQNPLQTFATQLSSSSWWARAGFARLFFSFLHWWKEQENFASNDCYLYKLHKHLLCLHRILHMECEKQHSCSRWVHLQVFQLVLQL